MREYARKRRQDYPVASGPRACPIDPPAEFLAGFSAQRLEPQRLLMVGEPGLVRYVAFAPCEHCGAHRDRYSPRPPEPSAPRLCEGCHRAQIAYRQKVGMIVGRLRTAASNRRLFSTYYRDQPRNIPCAVCGRTMRDSWGAFRGQYFHQMCWKPNALRYLVSWSLGRPVGDLITQAEALEEVSPWLALEAG